MSDVQDALELAFDALQHAETQCRYHGVNPPERTFGSGCDSCKQPTRVRAARAALQAVLAVGR